VLESRHVIGLFMLMLLFSGVFFTLGYVMGRNEYDGSVRAATDFFKKPGFPFLPRRMQVRSGRTIPLLPPRRRTRGAAEFGLGVLSRRRK